MPCMPRVFSTRSACSRSRLFLPFCPYTPDRRAAHHPQHKSQSSQPFLASTTCLKGRTMRSSKTGGRREPCPNMDFSKDNPLSNELLSERQQ